MWLELVLFFDETEDADKLAIAEVSFELGVIIWLFIDEAKGCFVGSTLVELVALVLFLIAAEGGFFGLLVGLTLLETAVLFFFAGLGGFVFFCAPNQNYSLDYKKYSKFYS